MEERKVTVLQKQNRTNTDALPLGLPVQPAHVKPEEKITSWFDLTVVLQLHQRLQQPCKGSTSQLSTQEAETRHVGMTRSLSFSSPPVSASH